MIGTKLLERYELTDELGRGGMGVVYRARDPLLRREVAVKMIPPLQLTPAAVDRFEREAQLVAQMDHPAIVPIYDFGNQDGSLFFVMPLLAGVNLRQMIRQRTLRLGQILDVVAQTAEALEYSHSRGVVHRDVKPENLMLTGVELEKLRVRVMDFGLALEVSQARLTKTKAVAGTVAYVSPEQASELEVDHRTDIYSLGVVAYECLTGEPPFDGVHLKMLYRIMHEDPPTLADRGADVDGELEAIVLSCLAKRPAQRPASAGDLAAAVRRCQQRLQAEELSRAVVLSPGRAPSRRPAPSPLIGLDMQWRELQQRLNAALGGECQLALLAGEVGTGKSRLLEELERLCRVRGIQVMRGRIADLEGALPYQGFCELIQDYFRSRETASAPSGLADLSDLAADLTAHFPMLSEIEELRQAAGGSQLDIGMVKRQQIDPTYLFELLARTLARLASGRPSVLLLENLHAGDVSIEALNYLVRRLGATPTLVAGNFRPAETDRAHPLHRMLQSFHDDRRFTVIRLGPLVADAFREWVEWLLFNSPAGPRRDTGATIDPEMTDRLLEATEGNAFFAQELIRSLLESDGIRRGEGGTWMLADRVGLTAALPVTIRQAVARRVELLPRGQRRYLATAAVLGRRFEYRDLEDLVGEADELDDAIDAMIRRGLLKEAPRSRGDRLGFASGVLRDVLYQGLPRRKRRLLHRRHAERLEKRFGGRLERVYPQLVRHFSEGDVADKTVAYATKLARAALAAFSPDEAVAAVETALEFVDEEEVENQQAVRAELTALAARAHRSSGRLEQALKHAERATKAFADAGDGVRSAGAALLAAETAWQARQAEDARRWVEIGSAAARGVVSGGDEPESALKNLRRLLTLGATIANLRGEHAEAQEYLDELDRIAPPEDSDPDISKQGGTLFAALPNPLASLVPGELGIDEEHEVAACVYEPLLRLDSRGVVAANLCERWVSSRGGRRFVFTLPPEACFSDGHKLTAHDVKSSFERAVNRACAPAGLTALAGFEDFQNRETDHIRGIEARDDVTLVLDLAEPLPIFPALLTDVNTAIVRPTSSGATVSEVTAFSGTGPFRVTEKDDENIVLERRTDYWRGSPALLDRVRFRVALDAAEIAAGLRAGEIDLGRDLLPEDLDQILRDPRLRSGLVEITKKNVYFVLFNDSGPTTRRPEIRRALAGAVRTGDLVWRSLGRFAEPASGFIPPGILGHDPGRRKETLTREQAAAALRGAAVEGLGRDGSVQLKAAVHPLLQDRYGSLTRALLAEWSALGAETEIVTPTMESYIPFWENSEGVDLLIGRWIADYDDPDDFAYSLFHSRHGLLRHYFCSEKADRLIESARQEKETARRQGLYRKFEDLLAAECVLVPLLHDIDYRIGGGKVRGLVLGNAPPYVNYTRIEKTETIAAAPVPRRPSRGREIHIPLAVEVESLDPAFGLYFDSKEPISTVFETLTRIDERAHIAPWLAESFEAGDGGSRWHFSLRPDVRFHDGRRLTTRDVRHSFERLLRKAETDLHYLLSPIRGAKRLAGGRGPDLAGFHIASDTDFTVELEHPLSFFPALLTYPGAAIVPEGCDVFDETIRESCPGTGPFRVLRFDRGQRLLLEKNPDYWREGFPKSDRLAFHFGIPPEEIYADFGQGRFSLASGLLPDDLEALLKDPELAEGYRESPRLATFFLALNSQRGPFADLGLRRALARALDVEALLRDTVGRRVTRAHGVIPPGLLGYEEPTEAPHVARDGTEVLAGVRLQIGQHPIYAGPYVALWEKLGRTFDELGLETETKSGALSEVLAAMRRGQLDLMPLRYIANYPDTDGFVGNLLRSGTGNLRGILSSPEIDKLIYQGRKETEASFRHSIYREIEEIIEREALLIPLFHEQTYRFCHPTMAGLRFGLTVPEVYYEELFAQR